MTGPERGSKVAFAPCRGAILCNFRPKVPMFNFWFRNLPVKRKIAMVVGFFSAILLVMLGLSIRDVRGAQLRTEAIYRNNLLPTGDLTLVRTSLLRALVLANNLLRAPNAQVEAAMEADMNRMDENFDRAWARYEQSLTSEVARRVAPEYHRLALEQRRVRVELLVPLVRKGDLAGARRIMGEQIDATDTQLGPLGAQLVKDGARQAADALAAGQAQYRLGMLMGIGFSLLGVAVGTLLGLALIKGIHEPLAAFGTLLAAVEKGPQRHGGRSAAGPAGRAGQRRGRGQRRRRAFGLGRRDGRDLLRHRPDLRAHA